MNRRQISRLKVLPETKDALLKHHATRARADKKAVDDANFNELVAELVANGAAHLKAKVRHIKATPDSIIPRSVPQEGAQ